MISHSDDAFVILTVGEAVSYQAAGPAREPCFSTVVALEWPKEL